ncbi:MAG TPA: glycosyltransferase, partial [Acidimicrobiales bacterium]|nr:glycosyltransferase [Acidimicrobiales bacterium]
DGIEVRATFIGDGPFEADLRRAAARLGIADAVTFAGPQPPTAVAATLQQADIFCLPSFAEGLPVSIMEAMATGVPVVTTYISGTPELVEDGVTGWIVPAGNAARLAAAIQDVASNPARAAIVEAARAAVVERHDLASNAKELAEVLMRCHDPEAAMAPR